MNKKVITFAGVPGSSKTPIAYYLSWNLGLPILNNDSMRTEVREDVLRFNEDEYTHRRDDRIQAILESGKTFIYDASVDRSWEHFSKKLDAAGYSHFVIDLELSSELLRRIHTAKGYTQPRFDELLQEHESFMQRFGSVVGLRITDEGFKDRLAISCDAVTTWLNT